VKVNEQYYWDILLSQQMLPANKYVANDSASGLRARKQSNFCSANKFHLQ